MRHRKGYRKLGRNTNQRKALLKGLAVSLFEHGRITTTLARAKELRSYAEKLVTIAKKQNAFAHRQIFATLQNKDITKKLMNEVGPSFQERPGGYTRVLKTGRRLGDNAEMALIELVGLHSFGEQPDPEASAES